MLKLRKLSMWLFLCSLTLALILPTGAQSSTSQQETALDFPTTWQISPDVHIAQSFSPAGQLLPLGGDIIGLVDGRCRLYYTDVRRVLVGAATEGFFPGAAGPGGDGGNGEGEAGPPPPGQSPFGGPDMEATCFDPTELIAQLQEVGLPPDAAGAPPFTEGEDAAPADGEADAPTTDGPPSLPPGGPPGTEDEQDAPDFPGGDGPPVGDEGPTGPPVGDAGDGSGPPVGDEGGPPLGDDAPGVPPVNSDGPPIGDEGEVQPPGDTPETILEREPEVRIEVQQMRSAISLDGIRWVPEPRFDNENLAEDGENVILSNPAIYRTVDGRIRMYYLVENTETETMAIASALSFDGRNFNREAGLRLETGLESGFASLGNMVVWRDAENMLWMIFSATLLEDETASEEAASSDEGAEGEVAEEAPPTHVLALASSSNGQDWTVVNPELFVDATDPALLPYADGTVALVWQASDGNFFTSTPLDAELWWEATQLTILDANGQPLEAMTEELVEGISTPRFSNPVIMRLADGSLRMYLTATEGLISLTPVLEENGE